MLIFRPLDNNTSEVRTPQIEFEVEISAFATIQEVRINGEVIAIAPGTSMRVKTQLELERGINTVRVEVVTEREEAAKEFAIMFRSDEEKARADLLKKLPPRFRVITVAGAETVGNALKAPEGDPEISATRSFLIMIPRYNWYFSEAATLRFQAIASRDQYDKEELTAEEIAFTQFTTSWIYKSSRANAFTVGLGYNLIYSGYKSLQNGENRQQYDCLLLSSWRRTFSRSAYLDMALEWKVQESVGEPVSDPTLSDFENELARESDEDATIPTLTVIWEWGAPFKTKLQGAYSRNDADGSLKDRTVTRWATNFSYAFGGFILGLGYQSQATAYSQPNPFFNDVAPEETLANLALTATYPVTRWLILSAEAGRETQTSNVASSEYTSTSTSTSLILAF